jgi:hypothetical protein
VLVRGQVGHAVGQHHVDAGIWQRDVLQVALEAPRGSPGRWS